MAQVFQVHPTHPQQRLLRQAASIISAKGVVVYPTDTSYALGCQIGAKDALERIMRIRGIKERHHFSILCRDLSDISLYAKVDNSSYRLLKAYLPGPYTFVLPATREVPRRLLYPKRKTIGIRVPDAKILQALLAACELPIITTSLILPGDSSPLSDPHDIVSKVGKLVDLVIDGGFGSFDETTLVDLTDEGVPVVLRQGIGQIDV